MFSEKIALENIVESLKYQKPETETHAFDIAQDSFNQTIDDSLTFTDDILEMWDGQTADEISLSDYSELSDAISASVYWQLRETYSDVVFDGVDNYIIDSLKEKDENDLVEPDGSTWGELLEGYEYGGYIDRDTVLYYLNNEND